LRGGGGGKKKKQRTHCPEQGERENLTVEKSRKQSCWSKPVWTGEIGGNFREESMTKIKPAGGKRNI